MLVICGSYRRYEFVLQIVVIRDYDITIKKVSAQELIQNIYQLIKLN